MDLIVSESLFFGMALSLAGYEIGLLIRKKWNCALLNPLLISIVIVITFLKVFRIDYQDYNEGAKYLSYLLTPSTVCLAIPLYRKLAMLKKYKGAVFGGILSGVLTSLVSVFLLAKLFELSHEEYVTLLPKSITTAIGMGVSEEFGGIVTITVAVIIITGILGNVIAEAVFRLFRIEEPVARGISLGTASHAIGTAKAMELGEVEGAMSSLSIVVAGVMTVAGVSLFAYFI